MSPDLNSLPPSPSPSSSTSPLQSRTASTSIHEASRTMAHSPSHTPPHSLAVAAAVNAGIQNEESRRTSSGSIRRDVERARRRSSIRMNLNLNDPTLPAPGELQMSPSHRARPPFPLPHSPHHERTPSLGELHQELEYEQEGQVNRLLNMIRQQQAQITVLQSNQQQQPSTSAVVDDSTPTSERSLSLPNHHVPLQTTGGIAQPRARSPYGTMSRQSSMAGRSRGSSHTGSPALRPLSGGLAPHESNEWLPGSAMGRDEGAFYQAETQMLTRENQMLKLRIRELERQISDLNPTSAITRSPVMTSSLHSSPPVSRSNTLSNTENTPPPNPGT